MLEVLRAVAEFSARTVPELAMLVGLMSAKNAVPRHSYAQSSLVSFELPNPSGDCPARKILER